MNVSELFYLGILVATHAIAYYMGKADAPEPFKPTNEAWVAVQCHAIDKQIEYWRWLEERKDMNASETEKIAPGGD